MSTSKHSTEQEERVVKRPKLSRTGKKSAQRRNDKYRAYMNDKVDGQRLKDLNNLANIYQCSEEEVSDRVKMYAEWDALLASGLTITGSLPGGEFKMTNDSAIIQDAASNHFNVVTYDDFDDDEDMDEEFVKEFWTLPQEHPDLHNVQIEARPAQPAVCTNLSDPKDWVKRVPDSMIREDFACSTISHQEPIVEDQTLMTSRGEHAVNRSTVISLTPDQEDQVKEYRLEVGSQLYVEFLVRNELRIYHWSCHCGYFAYTEGLRDNVVRRPARFKDLQNRWDVRIFLSPADGPVSTDQIRTLMALDDLEKY